MWGRFLSTINNATLFAEECWLGVHSDASLEWLFTLEFLTSTTTLPRAALAQFFKRFKLMICLRRKFADTVIYNQQEYLLQAKVASAARTAYTRLRFPRRLPLPTRVARLSIAPCSPPSPVTLDIERFTASLRNLAANN